MVAAFGLGAGWSALDRADRLLHRAHPGGTPLSEKQGYTHKLIVPHVVRLEAARAYIEETAERIDAGDEGNLNTEGAIAKYLATESGNAAAEAAIQAHGGYGYTREYMVEKIKRDVRITTIYEGTSEIMEMTIARDRWQQHLKTRGELLPRRPPRSWRRCTRATPTSGAGDRRAGRARAGRGARAGPGRPADPQPARPVPARRADRLGRDRRHVRPAGGPPRHGGRLHAKADTRFDAGRAARRSAARLRPRGRAEGRRRRAPRCCAAPPDSTRPSWPASSSSCASPTSTQAQAGLLDDMDTVAGADLRDRPAPDCLTD